MRLILTVIFLTFATITWSQASDSTSNFTVSAEFFGAAVSFGLYGEYILHGNSYHLSFSTGVGKTNPFNQEDWLDNLTVPHQIRVSFPSGKKPGIAYELATGGALDLYRNEIRSIRNGVFANELETLPIYRFIPITAGIKVSKANLFWRYTFALHVVPRQIIFPTFGIAFGGYL